jgi:hypothetical protein
MGKRRSLTDGLKSLPKADPRKEEAFVYGGKKPTTTKAKKSPVAKPEVAKPTPTPNAESEAKPEPRPKQNLGKSPLSTRLRTDIGEALKKASLQRELAKETPYTVQDILEVVLELWLKENGYLK